MGRKILIVVLVLIVGLVVFTRLFIRGGFPKHSGQITVAGIQAPVNIHRDPHGIPHIVGDSEADVYFGLGYAMAQDRLFQMEFLRAAANGTLSEILGEDLLDTDIFLRKLLLRPAHPDTILAAYPAEVQTAMFSFAEGINRFLESDPALPIEFKILGHHPAHWDAGDLLAMVKLQGWDLSYNYQIELIYRDLIGKVGLDRAMELFPFYGPDHFKLLTERDLGPSDQKSQLAQARWLESHIGGNGGSNAWVISGKRTVSGKPILASDPHLGGSQLPGPWYFAHLKAPGLDVAGCCFPGLPMVLIGFNDQIAWGLTNMGPDVQDLFIEELNPADATQYLYKGEWRPLEIIPQEIRVKDKDEPDGFRRETLLVKKTLHGPLMKEDEQALALSWTGHLFHEEAIAFYRINHAGSWEDFNEALSHFATAPQNFLYGDVHGTIGYVGAGKIPIRAKGDGRIPVPGWTGEYDWVDMIPYDSLPRLVNPPRNFILTANAEPVGADYPYPMPGIYAPEYRSRRIESLLEEQVPAMLIEQEKIQLDRTSLLAPRFLEYLLPLLPDSQAEYRQALEGMDGRMSADSGPAALYHETLHRFIRSVFEDELGPELAADYLDTWYISLNRWVEMLSDPGNVWFDDVSTPERETRDDLLLNAYYAAVDTLVVHFGARQIEAWSWGDLHSIEFHHLFESQGGLIRKFFNYGPFPFGGDGETINRATYDFTAPYETNMTASMRLLIDLGNPGSARVANASGQVGMPRHPHYTDLVDEWLAGNYVPFDIDLDKLPPESVTLTLEPAE